ncbi:hypothetical protein CONPUDRAFT_74960 [Coniophora puteana RWD-64-598 SS2]|uniref:Uncharacterized protein n=1 Tax=Coniophora puteana (strain RWD-64-598) TaxID=741705 RepID=A0A5M3MGZ6_CONPW|nr:uncharacterized protein CONPUDRAFT_74960 [Coniophora puteana RWD-64-598 SS2]EIW78220.1 hypothetical protein CONPUDRAFT_74960 [Coniophora puteana RWD-64-598 SS2]
MGFTLALAYIVFFSAVMVALFDKLVSIVGRSLAVYRFFRYGPSPTDLESSGTDSDMSRIPCKDSQGPYFGAVTKTMRKLWFTAFIGLVTTLVSNFVIVVPLETLNQRIHAIQMVAPQVGHKGHFSPRCFFELRPQTSSHLIGLRE